MSNFNQQLSQHKDALASTFHSWLAKAEQYLPGQLSSSVQALWHDITSTSKDDLIRDISNLKATPATTAVFLTTLVSLLVATRLILQGKTQAPKKKSKKKKKKSKAQVANMEIQAILDKVEEEFVPQIDSYIENYNELSTEKKEHTYNYIQEMLLKELMKLDGVEVGGSDVLRENRKKVIHYIQEHQSRLDKFKKEN